MKTTKETNLKISETERRQIDTENTCNAINIWNDDIEHLDEGVSDISSDSEHGANDQFTHHNENTKNYQIKVMISFHTLMANCNNSTIPENDMNVSIF